MRFNMEWLRDWVDIEFSAEQTAAELTNAGLEVDAVRDAAPGLSDLVVAEIRAIRPHPNADRLSLCTVFDGAQTHEVVCGAPNVAVGIKIPFAPVGARLPDGLKIKSARIRGEPSAGMLCSAKELDLSDDSAGLLILDAGAKPGLRLETHLRLPDAVIEVDLTPNRGDCFSVLGIARELAARTGLELKRQRVEPQKASHPEFMRAVLEAPEDCPQLATRVIKGLSPIAVSPDWLKERLRRAGSRPISPIVDVTNYVMLELGQPLHAYKLANIRGNIRARRAGEGEPLRLLDGTEVKLSADVLVIADDSGAIGLAGVMGGLSTSVDAETTDVLLESAFFAPAAIQGRARRFGLHTDASVRFERGVDPTQQVRAIERATALLLEIAGGTAGPVELATDLANIPTRPSIGLRHQRIESILGTAIAPSDIETWLKRLEMSLTPGDGSWQVVPPAHRFDISIEEDLIEEVGRMMGYDSIIAVPGLANLHLGTASEHRVAISDIADTLVARGFAEVISYSFIDPISHAAIDPGSEPPLALVNPISADQSVLRSSLWPGLIRAAHQNLSRQQNRCRLFEIGTVFAPRGDTVNELQSVAGLIVGSLNPEHWDGDGRDVDFFDLKADVAALLDLTGNAHEFRFKPSDNPALSPASAASIVRNDNDVGYIGMLHPKLQRKFDLKKDVLLFELHVEAAFAASVAKFNVYSKFPFVRRDLAVVVDEAVSAGDLTELIERELGDQLQKTIVFDQYHASSLRLGRKSLGIGLILQDASRTLTDDDADRMLAAVTARLEHELGATIRT
jgi:phenylalanyl-tRNA synthetase beta chain